MNLAVPAPCLQGAPNFRDLGGLPTTDGRRVRHGQLFRSQGLAELTDADLLLLATLGVRLVCDLRSNGERTLHPSRRDGGWAATWLEFDIHTDVRSGERGLLEILREQPDEHGADAMMLCTYRNLPRAFEAVMPRLFERLLSADGLPILIHCTAGKDRTGFAVAILLAALGVTREAVEADYLRSLQMIDRPRLEAATTQVMALFMGAEPAPSVIRAITTVRREYLQASYDAIDAEYGSMEGYLLNVCRLDATQRVQLAARLLTLS